MKCTAILLSVALGAFAIVYPSEASQATKIPLIGLTFPNRADDAAAQRLIAAFRQGLRELATLRVGTSSSRFIGRRESESDWLSSRRNWFGLRSILSSPAGRRRPGPRSRLPEPSQLS